MPEGATEESAPSMSTIDTHLADSGKQPELLSPKPALKGRCTLSIAGSEDDEIPQERPSSTRRLTFSDEPVTGNSQLSSELRNPDSPAYDSAGGRVRACGFWGYLGACTISTCGVSFVAVALWSFMGCGRTCLDALQTQQKHALTIAGIVLFMLIVLYVLDFFNPPHLPNSKLSLYNGDVCVGRFLLSLVALMLVVACFLAAKESPTLPLAMTIFLCPFGILIVRHATMPREKYRHSGQTPAEVLQELDFHSRIAMLRRLTGEERNQREFYKAAMCAFLIAGLACLVAFVPWAVTQGDTHTIRKRFRTSKDAEAEQREREIVFIFWAAPIIVAFANFVFASFAGLRVALNEAYTATDQMKNQLIVGKRSSMLNDELMKHRMTMLMQSFEATAHEDRSSPRKIMAIKVAEDRMQRYLVQHISHMRQLSNIVKTVGCALIVMLGALYIAFQLTTADSQIAQMVQGFFAACFLTFVFFIYVSFHRLWFTMHSWLRDLPLWRSARNFCTTSFARAAFVVLVLPLLPLVLGLSMLNQAVRRCRGLAGHSSQESDKAVKVDVVPAQLAGVCEAVSPLGPTSAPQTDGTQPTLQREVSGVSEAQKPTWLTERVQQHLDDMLEWDWLAVTKWAYYVNFVLLLWKVVPLFLNVLLAWMSAAIGDMPFVVILLVTFGAGMVLFMIPPVPGPPIYLFGGFVISDKCPWGFWWGSIICIALCFALKLSACAIQQKLIGERLGNNPWVRRTCGVHKPFIRAIESVLRQRGLSFGKCMILCGGPDWPTSVLAGILRLSLFQCELGTCPIIINVIPLSMTGSLYLKRDESAVWMRAGNLMFTLTVLTSVIFWAGMGWAIQNEFDKNHEALSRPKEEYVDLDWLDHRAAVINKRCALTWRDLPMWIRVPFVVGAFGLTVVSHACMWRFKVFFGNFAVTDDIADLEWYGSRGIITAAGIGAMSAATVCILGLIMYNSWAARRSRATALEAAKDIDPQEAAWKEARVAEAKNAAAVLAHRPGMQAKTEEWLNIAMPTLEGAEDVGPPTASDARSV